MFFASRTTNHYAYVGNDPVNDRDPTGLQFLTGCSPVKPEQELKEKKDEEVDECSKIPRGGKGKLLGPNESSDSEPDYAAQAAKCRKKEREYSKEQKDYTEEESNIFHRIFCWFFGC